MATTSDFTQQIAIINIVERVNTWVMPMEYEEPPTLEHKELQQKIDDDEEEGNILGDLIWLFCEQDTVEVGSGDAAAAVVLEPSESLGSAEQGYGAQRAEDNDVHLEMADAIPAGGRREEETEWMNTAETISTAVSIKIPRGRTRRFFAATWKGAKRLLLCGYCR